MANGRHLSFNARIAASAAAAGALLAPASAVLADSPSGPAAHASARAVANTHTAGTPSAPAAQKTNSEAPSVGPGAVQSGSQASTGAGWVVGAAPTADGRGFWMAWSNGAVTTAGDAVWYGDMAGRPLNGPIVSIASTPSGGGYMLLGSDGGVFTFGNASFYGSTGNMRLNSPALEMQSTPDGGGYDFVAGDGGVFTFGDGRFFGSTGDIQLNAPIVGMVNSPSGNGYWLVARDGGIFGFGDAHFYGSTGNIHLNAPVVGIARTHDGGGYWLVAQDGGVFSFGDAPFLGSAVGRTGGSPAIAIVATGDGGGYWVVTASGLIVPMGDASFSQGAQTAGDTNYAFEVTNGAGTPARWNPCEQLHYTVNPAGAPLGWQNDVSNAVSQAGQATGLTFVADPFTGQNSSYKGIVISWTSYLSGGDTVGLTTYEYYNSPGITPQLIGGQIQLLSSLYGGSGAGGEEPVLLHELGHALGLAHVNAAEVMNPYDQGFATYQPGDLNGLIHLGASQGCAGFYS